MFCADGETTSGASFERALYEGVVREGRVQHEAITLSGYDADGTEVQVFGSKCLPNAVIAFFTLRCTR